MSVDRVRQLEVEVKDIAKEVKKTTDEVHQISDVMFGGKKPQESVVALLDSNIKTTNNLNIMLEEFIKNYKDDKEEARKNKQAIFFYCLGAALSAFLSAGTVIYQIGIRAEQLNSNIVQTSKNAKFIDNNAKRITELEKLLSKINK